VSFRLTGPFSDELIAKCAVFGENPTGGSLHSQYDQIFYETQTMQLCDNIENSLNIKEEIIEFNEELQLITRYCVI
jgi:hypothetical protein